MEEHNMLAEEEFETSLNFHPIEVAPPQSALEEQPKEEFTIEIIYPNGVTLRVYSKSTVQLVDLIKLY